MDVADGGIPYGSAPQGPSNRAAHAAETLLQTSWPFAPAAREPGWTLQTSSRTGKQYWFNSKTGASTYEQPPGWEPPPDSTTGAAPVQPPVQRQQPHQSVRAAEGRGGGARPAIAAATLDQPPSSLSLLDFALRGTDVAEYTTAAEAVCKRISGGGGGGDGGPVAGGAATTTFDASSAGTADGPPIFSYDFPPAEKVCVHYHSSVDEVVVVGWQSITRLVALALPPALCRCLERLCTTLRRSSA